MCLCYLYSGKETGGQEEWIQVREKSKWSKYQKFIKNLFSQQFINSLYFPRNLSHHEDLGVARFLPRFDEEFDYFLIISPTKKIIHISFYKTKKTLQAADKSWKSLPKIERLRNDEADNVKSTGTFLFDTTHSQMLGKFEYTLPAKFWRLVGCTEMLSW